MPTSLSGFILLTFFLTPGSLLYIQRGKHTPQKPLSPLLELVNTIAISNFINLAIISIYGFAHLLKPKLLPNLALIFIHKLDQVPHANEVVGWLIILYLASCTTAYFLGKYPILLNFVNPIVIEGSSWYYIFKKSDSAVFVGCDLLDGSYVSGYLEWFNTHPDDIQDRDLLLTQPLTVIKDGVVDENLAFENILISARQISKIYVSQVALSD